MTEQLRPNKNINLSVIKTMDIIEYLSGKTDGLRLNDIAKGLNMNASTTLRFLATLRHCGYVDQNPETMKYHLTLKFRAISNNIDIWAYLRDVAHPYLHLLAKEFNECICLAVEKDFEVVYIDVVQGKDKLIRSEQRIGNSAHMHSTGIGKLLMLNYDEEQIVMWERLKGYTEFTSNTIKNREQLMKSLNEVRLNGYAFDNQECEIGAKCIAIPIRDYTGKVIAGISVSGTIFHLTDEIIEKNKPLLLEVAMNISRKMGFAVDNIK